MSNAQNRIKEAKAKALKDFQNRAKYLQNDYLVEKFSNFRKETKILKESKKDKSAIRKFMKVLHGDKLQSSTLSDEFNQKLEDVRLSGSACFEKVNADELYHNIEKVISGAVEIVNKYLASELTEMRKVLQRAEREERVKIDAEAKSEKGYAKSEEKKSKDSASEEDFEAIAEKAYASIIKVLPGSPNGFNKMDRSKQSKVLQKLAKDLKCAQGHDTFQDLKDAFELTSHENEISSKWTLFPKFEAEYGKVVCPHDEL